MANTGNISGMLPYAKLLVEGGFNTFLFDYQGFGGSKGVATATSLHGGAISAFDYLIAQRIAPPGHAIRSLDIGELSEDSDFDRSVGSGQ